MTPELQKQTEHPWQAKIVGRGPIGESGDYNEGYWQITNGELTLYTHDDDMSAEDEEEENQWKELLKSLNDCKAKFWTDKDDQVLELQMEAGYYKDELNRCTEKVEQLEQEVARLTGIIEQQFKRWWAAGLIEPESKEMEEKWQNYKKQNNL